MNWKTWTQLLAALVIAGICVYIGKLILPVVQTMTPVIAWTLTAVIVVVLISLGLGVPAAIVMGLRALHTHHAVKEIEARKLAVTERGFLQGYIARDERLLIPQITAHSVEVPGHVHIQEDRSTSAGGDPAQLATKILQEARNLIGGKYEALTLPPGMPAVPGPCTFSQALTSFQPSAERLLLAYLPGGDPAFSSLGGLCHVANAGATGGGKSSTVRLLMAQLCAVDASVLLLNPHYTRYDLESGEDWTPFEPYLLADPMTCRDYGVIEEYLRQAAVELLPRRLEKYAHSQPVGKPHFLVLDELPAIVSHVKKAPDYLAALLREGRKAKLFLITAAQDFLVKTVMGKDGSGAVRDCFRTAIYVGGDPTTARVLLDTSGAVDDGGLGKGVVMLRGEQVKKAQYARVPYVDNESLYHLLGPSTYVEGEATVLGDEQESLEAFRPAEMRVSPDETAQEADAKIIRGPFRVSPTQEPTRSPGTAVSDETKRTIARMYRQGLPLRDIAKYVGLAGEKYDLFKQACQELGIGAQNESSKRVEEA